MFRKLFLTMFGSETERLLNKALANGQQITGITTDPNTGRIVHYNLSTTNGTLYVPEDGAVKQPKPQQQQHQQKPQHPQTGRPQGGRPNGRPNGRH